MSLEDKSYNELRSLAKEKDADVSSHPDMDELVEALQNLELEDGGDSERQEGDKSEELEPDEKEDQEDSGDKDDTDSEPDLDLSPSRDAEGTLLSHEDTSEEEIDDTSDDSGEAEEEFDEEPDDELPETPDIDVDEEKLAAHIQMGLNRLQRLAGDILLGIKPRRLSPEEVRESVPALRDGIKLVAPRGVGGNAGKIGVALVAASPHVEAWKDAIENQQEEEDSDETEKEVETKESTEEQDTPDTIQPVQ